MSIDAYTEARAAAFAVQAHGRQMYGTLPYSVHLDAVRRVFLDSGIGGPLAVAAWLHDTIEDTRTTSENIRVLFGDEVAGLVWAVTGTGQNRRERIADAHAKIVAHPTAALLKLADRIANVEHCKTDGGPLFKMYRSEQPEFAAMINRCVVADGRTQAAMLARLTWALG